MINSDKPYFRTIETGTLPCPGGDLTLVTVKSPALSARADLTLYQPRQAVGRTRLPVVILLHGVYGSHWAWALKGRAHLTLQAMIDAGEIEPMILAMPSDGLWGDGSGYLPHRSQDFERWIVEDVPYAVSQVTGNPLASPHFIAGLSMGGFGAMRLGARHTDRFVSFAGHSSITHLEQMERFVEEDLSHYKQADHTIASVAEAIRQSRDKLRPFRFDCGTDDWLIEENRNLAASLKRLGVTFEYAEHPGGHDWNYWSKHLRDTLLFFGQIRML